MTLHEPCVCLHGVLHDLRCRTQGVASHSLKTTCLHFLSPGAILQAVYQKGHLLQDKRLLLHLPSYFHCQKFTWISSDCINGISCYTSALQWLSCMLASSDMHVLHHAQLPSAYACLTCLAGVANGASAVHLRAIVSVCCSYARWLQLALQALVL